MSRIHFLVCHEENLGVAIGQGWGEPSGNFGLWGGSNHAMKCLQEFLRRTYGKSLVMMEEEGFWNLDEDVGHEYVEIGFDEYGDEVEPESEESRPK